MYQSEWTTKPVLHLVPGHWCWKKGDTVDVWAYYNNADEVELYLNNKPLGVRRKNNDELHVMWKVKYEEGTLKAVSKKNGKIVLVKELKTALASEQILLKADRHHIKADGRDLSFITVKTTDKNGNFFPSNDLIKFTVTGPGIIAGVDNGSPTSMESFKSNQRRAFNGLCLLIVASNGQKGKIHITASSENGQGVMMKSSKIDVMAE